MSADEFVVTVKEKDCPSCGTAMGFEEGESYSHESPSAEACYYCPECGYECEVSEDDIEVEEATKSELEETL